VALTSARVPSELCLILETSTHRGSAVLADRWGGVVVDGCVFESDRNHNSGMFGPLERMLTRPAIASISLVLVGAGPGSYSGTRVGIAVAQGVAIARGCPAVAVPSLVGVEDASGPSLAIGDARRGHWWWVRLDGRRMETPAPQLGDKGDLQREADAAKSDGLGIFTFENPEAFGIDAEVVKKSPDAGALWQGWLEAAEEERAAWTAAPPQPCYLKPPHITPPKRPWLQG